MIFFLIVQRRIAFGLTAGAVRGMSELERLAAACIFPSFPGPEAPDWILRGIEDGLGGICLFSYNVGDREQLAG